MSPAANVTLDLEALPFKGRVWVGMGLVARSAEHRRVGTGWARCGRYEMKGQTNERIRIPKLQRTLRKRMTDAENALWRVLRGRQLEDCKFRRQHPYGDHILDFVCLEQKLVIEVDGGQHLDSARDARRDAHLRDSGFTVLRFWNDDVLTDGIAVADEIARTITRLKQTHPHPGPPLEGEGDDTGDLHPRVRTGGAHSKSGT